MEENRSGVSVIGAVLMVIIMLGCLGMFRFLMLDCGEDGNLIVISKSGLPIYGASVESSQGSDFTVCADGSALRAGDGFAFQVERWPTVVSIYGDREGSVKLASCVVEAPPRAGGRWFIALWGDSKDVKLELTDRWPGT